MNFAISFAVIASVLVATSLAAATTTPRSATSSVKPVLPKVVPATPTTSRPVKGSGTSKPVVKQNGLTTVSSVATNSSNDCFKSTAEWRDDFSKRIQGAVDTIAYELESSIGFFGVIRRLGLRLARRNLDAMRKEVTKATSDKSADDKQRTKVLAQAEKDLINIAGTLLKRTGRWTARSCCYLTTTLRCGSRKIATTRKANRG